MSAKRWKTSQIPSGTESLHTSEGKAYELVNTLRATWADGSSQEIGVKVYVYDLPGASWQLFDRHMFAAGD